MPNFLEENKIRIVHILTDKSNCLLQFPYCETSLSDLKDQNYGLNACINLEVFTNRARAREYGITLDLSTFKIWEVFVDNLSAPDSNRPYLFTTCIVGIGRCHTMVAKPWEPITERMNTNCYCGGPRCGRPEDKPKSEDDQRLEVDDAIGYFTSRIKSIEEADGILEELKDREHLYTEESVELIKDHCSVLDDTIEKLKEDVEGLFHLLKDRPSPPPYKYCTNCGTKL